MAIEFQTKAQEDTYQKVASWMKEMFGEFATTREDAPVFGLQIGSAWATVAVYPWGDDDAVVRSRAYVITGVELTQDLLHYLLKENDSMRFGAFGVDEDDDIFFDYAVVGSTLDKPELRAAAMAVVGTADSYDDQIVSRWGGQRAIDRK